MTNCLRILVVEDDSILATVLAEILESMGHEVCAIEATETDVVTAAARCNPDLMIVDTRLREGSGLGAVERICRNGFIPHLFASGDIASIKMKRSNAVVVQKPFREADLADAITRVIQGIPTC